MGVMGCPQVLLKNDGAGAMRKADFYMFKWIAWFCSFIVCSEMMIDYENLMNSVGLYSKYAGHVLISTFKTNLFNEGAIGYGILALVFLSAAMWAKEIFGFTREVQRIALRESQSLGLSSAIKGEVKL